MRDGLRLEALSYTYETGTEALREVDFEVRAGQTVAIVGSSGSGKSTLLNAIAGACLPDAGSIRIDGNDITRQSEFRRAALIGRVFQDPFKGTCPSMSVAENLRMAELRGSRRGLRVGLNRSAFERYRALLAGLGMRLDGRLNHVRAVGSDSKNPSSIDATRRPFLPCHSGRSSGSGVWKRCSGISGGLRCRWEGGGEADDDLVALRLRYLHGCGCLGDAGWIVVDPVGIAFRRQGEHGDSFQLRP